MHKITIKEYPTEVYELNEDMEFEPMHEGTEIEPPCCSGIDSEGNPSCGCHGMSALLCPAFDCPGITDAQAERLFDALTPDPEDRYYD